MNRKYTDEQAPKWHKMYKDPTVPVSKVCNTIKMDLEYKLWIHHIRRILEKHDKN